MASILWRLCLTVGALTKLHALVELILLIPSLSLTIRLAFDAWLSDQLKHDELAAVFNMLALEKRILPEFPSHLSLIDPRTEREPDPADSSALQSSGDQQGSEREGARAKGAGRGRRKGAKKRLVRREAVRTLLNDMLGHSGGRGDAVSQEDVDAFMSEIATNHPNRGIHFDDFLHLFR